MDIESVRHKALRKLLLEGRSAGLDAQLVGRIRKMLTFLLVATPFDQLLVPPNYGLHALGGDKAGRWSMTVSRNWRMTFVKIDDNVIGDLDLEDYH
jgi:toxin HigB-1